MSAVYVVTNAPTDYDWGWTQTEIENYGQYKGRNGMGPVRLVCIEDEYHAEMQQGRYGSGLHYTRTQAVFLQESKDYPEYSVVNPVDEQIKHYRKDVEYPEGAMADKEFVKGYYMPLTKQESVKCKSLPNTRLIHVHSTNAKLFDYTIKALAAGIAKLKL